MSEKMDELERLAREATRPWGAAIHVPDDSQAALVAACSPERTLALVAVARAAKAHQETFHPEVVPSRERQAVVDALAALEKL